MVRVITKITTGNGTFSVTANSANAGSGLVGASTVSNAADYDGGTYQIQFTPAGGVGTIARMVRPDWACASCGATANDRMPSAAAPAAK